MQVRSEDRYRGFATTVIRVWKAGLAFYKFKSCFSSPNLQQRGAAGFFDGASLRMSRKILSSAIGWAVFEGMLLFMQT
jgi:solute carrier family 25 protein 38